MLGSKAFDPMMLTDFFAFHAPEILKTFEIRQWALLVTDAASPI